MTAEQWTASAFAFAFCLLGSFARDDSRKAAWLVACLFQVVGLAMLSLGAFPDAPESALLAGSLDWCAAIFLLWPPSSQLARSLAHLLLLAWAFHVALYLDLRLGTDRVYGIYTNAILAIGVAQLLLGGDELARIGGMVRAGFALRLGYRSAGSNGRSRGARREGAE